MRSLTTLPPGLAALALMAALAPGVRAQEGCGDSITYFSPVTVGPGQSLRLNAFNITAPDPSGEKAGAVTVTLRFELYGAGQAAGGGALRHTASGERSSGRLTLGPGEALSLGFTSDDDDPDHPAAVVRALVLGHSSLPGGSAAPLQGACRSSAGPRATLEVVETSTRRVSSILVGRAAAANPARR